MTSTPLAGERLRPLGHLSVAAVDKEKVRHNQQQWRLEWPGPMKKTASPQKHAQNHARNHARDRAGNRAGRELFRFAPAGEPAGAGWECNWRTVPPDRSGLREAEWLIQAFDGGPNRVICATDRRDSGWTAANEARSWLNRGVSSVMSAMKKQRGAPLFRELGMGQGKLSFSKKPRPV